MREPRAWALVLAGALAACHGSSPIAPAPPPPPARTAAALELVLGGPISQTGLVIVTVTARDADQAPLAGVVVHLAANSGALDDATVTTSSFLGQAQTLLRGAAAATITVTATSDNGTSATAHVAGGAASGSVAPDFSFAVSKTGPATGEPVYFSLTAAGGPLSGRVDFGDGQSVPLTLGAVGATISHSYRQAGTLTATARLAPAGGVTITHSLAITIVTPAPAAVSLSSSPANATAADVITLSASVSNGKGVGYAWDWTADGTIDLQTTSSSTTHLYAAGSYRARVTVTLEDGNHATAEAAFTVAIAAAPTVTLTANTVTVGSATTLTATVAHGTPTSYTWNPGDGSAATTTASSGLSYSYGAAGTYTATVDVALAEGGSVHGQTSAIVQTVPAPPPLTVTMAASGSMQTGSATGLTAIVTGGTPATFAWDFGDLSTVTNTSASLSHVYTSAGTYTVTVTVTDALARTAVGTTSVAIVDPLTASLTVGALGTVGNPTTFNVTVSGGTATDAAWDFGDGSTLAHGSTTGLSHVYTTTGTYTVAVMITDTLGRIVTASVVVTVS